MGNSTRRPWDAREGQSWSLFSNLAPLCLIGLLAITAAFGGASRHDVPVQIFNYLGSIFVLGLCLWSGRAVSLAQVRWPLLLLLGCVVLYLLQLVPLPPSLWRIMPGHAPFLQADALAGAPEGVWRPTNLAPDRGWSSLMAFFPPLAVIVAFSGSERRAYPHIMAILVGVLILSGLLGVAQVAGMDARLYTVTNESDAVGLFANRNHFALLASLAPACLAALGVVSTDRKWLGAFPAFVFFLIGSAAFLAIAMASGSRGALPQAVIGLCGAVWILASSGVLAASLAGISGRLLGAFIVIVALIGVATIYVQYVGERYSQTMLAEELRYRFLPIYRDLAGTFFPFGSGFGSFESVFKHVEPFDVLRTSYLNHAHNDLVEVVIEGGLLAAVLVLAYLIWWARTAWSVVRRGSGSDPYRKLGLIMTFGILVGSAVDYPLRTPIVAVIFTLASLWMLDRHKSIVVARRDRT